MPTVASLAEKGFKMGPSPEEDCRKCRHNWGKHELHKTFDDAIEGGTWSCPECNCFGTWDVPQGMALKNRTEGTSD